MHDMLVRGIGYVVPLIELIGIAIVLWGILHGLVKLANHSWMALRGLTLSESLDDIRIVISSKLVLGLEFFLSGDVIQTIVVPSWQSLGVLGGIVGIRTVIVYFLDKEMKR